MTSAQEWKAFPMGPKLRAFIGLDESEYVGQHVAEPGSDEQSRAFVEFLSGHAKAHGVADSEALSDLLDELVTMALPDGVLRLAAEHEALVRPDDFRAQLCIGVAAMMRGDLVLAEDRFRAAQEIIPEEPAPYVNLVQIFLDQGRIDDAELWCVSGLDADPNNFRLWDLLARVYRERFGEYMPDRLMMIAEKRGSWAGLSLGANLTTTGDRYLKLSLLERLYHQGERDPQFLIELTAAMGVAGEFERIPQVVWQAERMAQKGLPWQLHAHCAQAHLALGKKADSLIEIAKARRDQYLPVEVKPALDELEAEANAPDDEPSLH